MVTRNSLIHRALGGQYDALPPALRALHDIGTGLTAEGRADVVRGSSRMSRLVAALFRLPPAMRNEPVWFDFVPDPDSDGEIWRRDFNGHIVETRHRPRRRKPGQIVEGFGPLRFVMAVVPEKGGMTYEMRSARLLGMPLPRFLRPRIEAREAEVNGCFTFESTITLPFGGRLFRYRGWLVPRAMEIESRRRPPSQEIIDTVEDSEARPPVYEARTRAIKPEDRPEPDGETVQDDDSAARPGRRQPTTQVGR